MAFLRRSVCASLISLAIGCLGASPAAAVKVSQNVPVSSSGNIEAPRISGEEVVGGKLTTTTGAWSWTPSGYAFQWLVCNGSGRKCAVASSLTSQTIVVPAAAEGKRLRVKVTAIGSGKSASATSSPTGQIAPPPAPAEPPQSGESSDGAEDPSTSPAPPPGSAEDLFREEFAYPEGLITNEYATWNPNHGDAKTSSVWEMTSGSLFAQAGTGWTGIPDGCSTSSPSSSPCTASDVFRLNSVRHDFGDVTVSFDLRNNYLTSSSRTPAENWDGVHLWLHYRSEYELYYASFNRRDGRIVIKKKCPGGSENGGTYYELSNEVSGYPIPFGAWQHLAASIRDNADGSVTITMSRNGTRLLSATDGGLGCAPIGAPGSVGVRGDNDDFNIDNFVVTGN
jgi:hypothetical protein